jgi:hypothetical protein
MSGIKEANSVLLQKMITAITEQELVLCVGVLHKSEGFRLCYLTADSEVIEVLQEEIRDIVTGSPHCIIRNRRVL